MSTLLKIDKLSAWYGDTRVLNEVDIEIKEGEIVALLGRNGMGKTTTLHSVCGITVSYTHLTLPTMDHV